MEIVASMPAGVELSEVAEQARRAERLGFAVLHVTETTHDPFVVSALALQATSRIGVRTSMALAFPRSPMVVALSTWDLAKLSGGRFQLGLASQVRGNIVGRFSTEWTAPAPRMRDYLRAVRAIFDAFQAAGPLRFESEHYTFTRLQPYFNPGPIDAPAPSLWTGGVNPEMCAMAGAVADGFIAHPTSSHPQVLAELTLPALERGARAAGRRLDEVSIVAGPQPILAADEAGLTRERERRRRELGFLYSTPAYRPQLALLGCAELGETLSARAAAKDWEGLDRVLPDEAVSRLVPEARYESLPEVLGRWYAGVCDGIVLSLSHPREHDERMAAAIARCAAIPTRREALSAETATAPERLSPRSTSPVSRPPRAGGT